MNACEQLAALYKRKAAEGLISVSFYLSEMVRDGDQEAVCAEVLRMEEAIERGDVCTTLEFNDLRWKE